MDRDRFDALTRLFARKDSRRSLVGALLGAGALGLSSSGSLAKKERAGKHRNDHRKDRKDRGRRKIRSEAAAGCFTGSPCIPGLGANLGKCDFESSSTLKGAACAGCYLGKANLRKADASGANFAGVSFSGACLTDANLKGATLAGAATGAAIMCRTVMPNGTINNSGCNKATTCCPTCIPFGDACGGQLGGVCCDKSAVCLQGTCRCPAGQSRCSDGICRECCDNGQQSTCAAGRTCCDNICVNLKADPNNCCECGRKCGAGEICSNGLTCQPATCLPVTATSGDVICAPNGGLTLTTEGAAEFGAFRMTVPAGTKFSAITSMKADFKFTTGQCGVGSPRFVVFLKNGRCPYAQFPPPLCNFPNAQGSTGELIGNNTPFVWNGELCGGSNADHTWNQVFALYQNVEIDRISLVVDESGGEETVTIRPCVTVA